MSRPVRFISIAALCFLLASSALAQGLPVAINTTRIEITASPGEKASSSFTFWNGTDEFLPIHLEAADFAPQDEEGHVTVGAKIPEGNSLKEWLHPELNDFAVAPKQEFEMKFTVDVPTTADPGTHYGALLVTTAPITQAGGAAVQVRIGPIILVKVLGSVTEKLTLESFTVPRFMESPPIALEARFKNEGTVHEAPSGIIEVRNMFGGLVAAGTRYLSGMCCQAQSARSKLRSAKGFGWGDTRFCSGRNTAMPARDFIAKQRFGWCHGGLRDGSFLLFWVLLSGQLWQGEDLKGRGMS